MVASHIKKKTDLYLPKLRRHIAKSTGKYRWIQFFGLHSPPVHPGSDSVSSSFSVLISGFLSSSVIVLVSTISTKRFPLRSPVMLWAILKSRASRADDFLVTRPLKLEHICDWPGVEIKLTRYCDWLSAALQRSEWVMTVHRAAVRIRSIRQIIRRAAVRIATPFGYT